MKSFLAMILLLLGLPALARAGEDPGQFVFDGWAGPPLRVLYTLPPGLTADRPVVFVMHGQSRATERYHAEWRELAIEHDFLLIVPEFTAQDFPGSRAYNLGNMTGEDGAPVRREQWSFSAIPALFEDVRRRFGMTAEHYALFGHSAGSQFVHRFLMYFPDAPVSRVVAANAGWYTMPDDTIDYPYGLRGSDVGPAALTRLLGLDLTVLLGDADTLTDQDNLRQTAEALAQGAHRLARGQSYFEQGRQAADRLGAAFNWRLVTVPGADHDNGKMAPVAVRYLLPDLE